MAKLALNVSKRPLENDEEPTESTTKKRTVSKSSGSEKSSSKRIIISILKYSLFFFTVRTVTTVAGQAPVDTECTDLLGKVHVYQENKDIFDCMLNQVRRLD